MLTNKTLNDIKSMYISKINNTKDNLENALSKQVVSVSAISYAENLKEDLDSLICFLNEAFSVE